jgi:hypothetical protein
MAATWVRRDTCGNVIPLLTNSQTWIANVFVCILIDILFWPRVSVWGAHCCQSTPRLAVGAVGACHVCRTKLHPGISLNISLRFSGAYVLDIILVMSETRSSIVLTHIAKNTRKATGDPRYRCSAEIGKPSIKSLIKTSCTRPLCTQNNRLPNFS